MIKTEGRVFDAVADMLRALGLDPQGLEVASLGRGTDHLILLDGETVGEYNHRSARLLLYSDIIDPANGQQIKEG